LTIIGYFFLVFVIFEDDLKNPCVSDLLLWLSVYASITALHIVRVITNICIWKKAKDPKITALKMEIFFGVWVFLAEVAWTFYGNFIVYKDRLNVSCKDSMLAE